MTGSYEKMRQILAVAFVLAFIGLLLQMLAIFSPAWYYTDRIFSKQSSVSEHRNSSWYLYEGIWLARFCTQDGVCIVRFREQLLSDIGVSVSLSPLYDNHWLEFKILSCTSIVGAVVCLTSCLVALVQVRPPKKQPICRHNVILITVISGALLSCSTLVIPALKLCAVLDNDQFSSSWSMLLALAGCGVQLLTVMATLRAFCVNLSQMQRFKLRIQRRSQRHFQHSLALSSINGGGISMNGVENAVSLGYGQALPVARGNSGNSMSMVPMEIRRNYSASIDGIRSSRDGQVQANSLRPSNSPPPYTEIDGLSSYSKITVSSL